MLFRSDRSRNVQTPWLSERALLKFAADAGGANSLGDFRFRLILHVDLNSLPETGVVPNLLANRANWNEPAQSFDLGEGGLQVLNDDFLVLLSQFAFRDVLGEANDRC